MRVFHAKALYAKNGFAALIKTGVRLVGELNRLRITMMAADANMKDFLLRMPLFLMSLKVFSYFH